MFVLPVLKEVTIVVFANNLTVVVFVPENIKLYVNETARVVKA